MSAALRRFILLALLLIVPTQGMAAVLHAFTCAPREAAAASAAHAMHEHGGASHHHDAAPAHDDSAGGGGDSTQHQCCHPATAAPMASLASAPADLPVFQSSDSAPGLSFVPEQPQRPPRA